MNRFARECRRRNLESRDAWSLFAEHRESVTRRIESLAAGGRLCVLGAGNCNDLCLPRLLEVFDSVELIDLDEDALTQGVRRQQLADCERIVCHGGCDLTGLMTHFSTENNEDVRPSADELSRWLARIPPVSEARFDFVASVCTLSQIIEMAVQAMGSKAQRVSEAALAARRQHLRLMLSLLQGGGIGLLVTDFVSSQTCPEIHDLSPAQLPHAARNWIANRNFFTGTNPFAIKKSLLDEQSGVDPKSVVIHKPWKWDLGPRAYAVTSIQFRRTTASMNV